MATATAASEVVPPGAAADPSRRPGLVVVAIVALLIVAGGWLRFASLGRHSFWADEFPHAVGARSLIHEGSPRLHSGRDYRRALPQTIAVAASMRAFGENERAARLPSAIIGLATIPLLWLVVRRRFGETTALASATAVAVMPLHVAHSRSARFYAAFIVAYGITAVLASHALESRSRRAAVWAGIAFASAMLLQVLALIVLAPLAVHALWLWHRSSGDERRARGRVILLAAAAVAAVAIVMMSIPSVRDSSLRLLREPVPGLRFGPGVHLDTIFRPFAVVSWWAWIPLAPLALLGLRRAGRAGALLGLYLIAPVVLIASLFESTTSAGVGSRYFLHFLPFVATVAGVACTEGARLAAGLLRRTAGDRVARPVAVAAAALAVAGIAGVWKTPGEAHPTKVIPRPNWNAAGAVIRANERPGDALLSTSPLAMSWVTGRCGQWLREAAAARVYMVDGRDIYCGTRLLPDRASVERYLRAHPRGWVVADPKQWLGLVDPDAAALIESTARRVDAGDPSVLLLRWG